MESVDIKKNTKIKETFGIDDILCVSYLLTQGIELVDIVRDSPYHFTFFLSDPEKCQELKHRFLNNAVAPARELFANREMLISEIKGKRE